tara:strand:+ start:301 stop:519 length:219 start_codon:yes stop_codon:yes gene_type:complete
MIQFIFIISLQVSLFALFLIYCSNSLLFSNVENIALFSPYGLLYDLISFILELLQKYIDIYDIRRPLENIPK